jgi:hypothetical protein
MPRSGREGIPVRVRSLCLIVVLLAAGALSACGGGDAPQAAKGAPQNPLHATPDDAASGAGRANEAGTPAAKAAPGYTKLLASQSRKPQTRFSPCDLVSKAKAGSILGYTVVDVTEAPQGPTCLYKGKDASAGLVALAVQVQPVRPLKHAMRQARAVDLDGTKGYCGVSGQPMLYAKLPQGRVLTVTAPCAVAQRFASTALAHLAE